MPITYLSSFIIGIPLNRPKTILVATSIIVASFLAQKDINRHHIISFLIGKIKTLHNLNLYLNISDYLNLCQSDHLMFLSGKNILFYQLDKGVFIYYIFDALEVFIGYIKLQIEKDLLLKLSISNILINLLNNHSQ
jgi:hypothetical protein